MVFAILMSVYEFVMELNTTLAFWKIAFASFVDVFEFQTEMRLSGKKSMAASDRQVSSTH